MISNTKIPTKNLLLVFVRHPELGKCKTRLAKSIGDKAALEVYKLLLKHTASVIKPVAVDKQVWYADKIVENDLWERKYFSKKRQKGNDLGQRMQFAFEQGFIEGYERIVIVGSDLYELSTERLKQAFSVLHTKEFVLGPAKDGGYYLLGMNQMNHSVFQHKNWSTSSVFKDTLNDLKNKKLTLLPELNDIDEVEDIQGVPAFQKFL